MVRVLVLWGVNPSGYEATSRTKLSSEANPFSTSFRCSAEYVGEYCQYKNPCNNGEQKCQNGGTCSVILSATQAPTFKVCPLDCYCRDYTVYQSKIPFP
jgi:hypothetical protein